MLNKLIPSFLLLLFSYIRFSLQSSIDPNTNIINYSYYDKDCEFIVFPRNDDRLRKQIGKCDNVVEDLNYKYKGKEINFHGKIHISSTIFELINTGQLDSKTTYHIISQISKLFNHYHNSIYSWDINDDLITNDYVTHWIEKMNRKDSQKGGVKSPVLSNNENTYITPYLELLRKIFVLENSVNKRLHLNYRHSVNLDTFNEEVDTQKLGIIHQMIQQFQSPPTALQFQFLFGDRKGGLAEVSEMENQIYQFIANMKIFSNLNLDLVFLLNNFEHTRYMDFDRYFQKCQKNFNRCTFSFMETVQNYNPEVSYNFHDINRNVMASYYNSNINILKTQFQKRDTVVDMFNITFCDSKGKTETKTLPYDSKSYKFETLEELTYKSIYDNYKYIRIRENCNDKEKPIEIKFDVLINTADNGDRSANYIFDALALWIQQKHQEKIDNDKKSKRSQSDDKNEEKKIYHEFAVTVRIKNDRDSSNLCEKNEKNDEKSCPDFALLTSNDISINYKNSDLSSLDNNIREYYKNYGITLESKIYKYAFYDYHIDNQWMAIPFTVQVRTLIFNSTTFEYCNSDRRESDIELKSPPPHDTDYWDSSSDEKTWNWKTFFKYGSRIKECTGIEGITLFGDNAEELKFLSMYVQSVGIPFIIETDNKIKMFATEKEESIDKEFSNHFNDIRNFLKNKNANQWITEESINEWNKMKNPFPGEDEDGEYEGLIKKFKKIPDDKILTAHSSEPMINGMAIVNPEKMEHYFKEDNKDVKYAHVPGISSYYGGEGFVITNSTVYKDEAFELITLFINSTLPFVHDANKFITPFEDTENIHCKKSTEYLNECNDYIQNAVSTIYYFIDSKNEYVILNAEHVPRKGNENAKLVIGINDDNNKDFLKNYYNSNSPIEFTCGPSVDYDHKYVTYYNNRIDLPVKINNTISTLTIKGTNDYLNSKSTSDISLCSVANDMLKIARPIQYPLNGFNKMNEIEDNELVAILFLNFCYKHKTKDSENIIKDLQQFKKSIDYTILPGCNEIFETVKNFSECHVSTLTMDVYYKNCKIISDETYSTTVCEYIPYANVISILTIIVVILLIITGIGCLILMFKHRKSKNLSAFGMDFSIVLLFATFILTVSIFFWLGEADETKCHTRIWLQTLGLTNIVGIILLKEERISSIFIGRDVQKIFTPKMKDIYIKLGVINIVQIALLVIWSVTGEKKYTKIQKYYNNLGYKEMWYCNIFDSKLIAVIFLFIFCMIIYTLLISIKIRNIPKEFNESRFIISSSTFQIIMIFFVFFVCIITEEEVYRSICYILCMLFLIMFTRPLFIEYKLYCIITKKTTESSIVIVNASSYISSSDKKSDYQTTQFKNTNGAVTEVHSIF